MMTPPPLRPTRIQSAMKMTRAPRRVWTEILWRTFLGAAIIAIGFAGGAKLDWPWQATATACGIGGLVADPKLVLSSLRHAVPVLRAVVDTIAGRSPAEPPADA